MPTLRSAFDTFILDCRARGLRTATLLVYRRQIEAFIRFCETLDISELDQVDVDAVRAYITHLQAREMKPASIRIAGHVLRAWLNFCIAEGLTVAESPMRRVRMPKLGRPQPDIFTKDEVLALLAAAATLRDKAIVLCLLDTGCRVGEFAALRVGNVSLHDGAVRIRHETTKTDAARTVFLGRHARAALADYLAGLTLTPQDAIWRTERGGGALTRQGLRTALKRIGEHAQVYPAGAHKYRRTALTYMLRDGMSVYEVADIAGHSTIDLLKHYISRDDAALAASHARHGMVDHLLK
jgi:site-specific recombinase XerD